MPNVALIEDLQREGRVELGYVGTDGIEKEIVARLHIPYHTISCPKLVRGGGFSAWKNNLKIPFALHRAVRQAKEGLRLFQPDLVFSKGGFVGLPVVLACKKLKIPCYAHESDLSVGLANRLSVKKCKKVFTSFPETAKKLKGGQWSGAPIRKGVLAVDEKQARETLGVSEAQPVLLILGGGSGSRAINEGVRKHIKALTEKYLVLHICGKGNKINGRVKNYRQFEFVADMGPLYAAADGIISRAGAGAIFEIMALKKPALFIPLQGATRGDQAENADYFLRKGLCHVLPQTELDRLPFAVDKLFADERLKERLKNSCFTAGNERILAELNRALYAK